MIVSQLFFLQGHPVWVCLVVHSFSYFSFPFSDFLPEQGEKEAQNCQYGYFISSSDNNGNIPKITFWHYLNRRLCSSLPHSV